MPILQSNTEKDIQQMFKLLDKAAKELERASQIYYENRDIFNSPITHGIIIDSAKDNISTASYDMKMYVQEKKSGELSERAKKDRIDGIP
jgi:hypothetical protein